MKIEREAEYQLCVTFSNEGDQSIATWQIHHVESDSYPYEGKCHIENFGDEDELDDALPSAFMISQERSRYYGFDSDGSSRIIIAVYDLEFVSHE